MVARDAQTRQLLRQLIWGRETADVDRNLTARQGVAEVDAAVAALPKKQPGDAVHIDRVSI